MKQGDVRLLEEIGQPGTAAAAATGMRVPVGKRRYLESSTLDLQTLIKAFREGRLMQ